MLSRRKLPLLVLALLAGAPLVTGTARADGQVTIAHPDRVVEVDGALVEPGALLVPAQGVERASGFALEEGAGLTQGGISVAATSDGPGAIVVERGGRSYVDLLALAAKLEQASVADPERRVFGFGPVPALRAGRLETAEAPDFALPDRTGKIVRLSDFRGKKVLILTWASW